MNAQLCLYKEARKWSDTTVVSIPAESCRQLGIEEGTALKIKIERIGEEDE